MSVEDVAAEYARALAAEKLAALASVKRSWGRMGSEFDASWQIVRGPVVAAVEQAQGEVARLADDYIAEVAPLTVSRLRDADYAPNLAAWRGVTGAGQAIPEAADVAIIHAKQAVNNGATTHQALKQAGDFLTASMKTALADTSRGVEQMGLKSRQVGMYVRMVTGASTCGRCVILAGKRYKASQAFLRHPGCDCTHIPVSEDMAGDLMTNPHAYFDNLDDDALVKALGSKANAKAWRDGADVNQLVNAYRRKGSIQKAQQFGRRVSITTEGMTRRGLASSAVGAGGVRLMPSSIYELAKDRGDAIRLLKSNGWIL